MMPPQTDIPSTLDILPINKPTHHFTNNNFKPHENYSTNNETDFKPYEGLKLKSVEELYANDSKTSPEGHPTEEFTRYQISNGTKIDLVYLRAREAVQACGVVPDELEVRDGGVFAKSTVEKCTKYGPFKGKWEGFPQETRFAWEVSGVLEIVFV